MSQTNPNSVSTDSLPQPPRPVNAKARRRALMEPVARSWMILTALICVTLVVVTIQGFLQWRSISRMIESGAAVQAIAYGDGARIKGRPLPIGQTVYIEYEYNGKKYQSQGPLIRTGDQYTAGEPFEVRLDPDNPTVWSNRKQPTTMRENMVGAILTSLFAALSIAITLGVRWRNLQLWRNGELRDGRIVEHRQSALAPKSVGLHCAVRAGKQDNLMTVYVPQSGVVPAVGQTVPLLTNSSATSAIAVSNYHA